MNNNFSSISFDDIKFLSDEDCLYSIDFRATGEALDRDINAMFKYENMTKWLTTKQKKRHIVVNEMAGDIEEPTLESFIASRVMSKAHTSIYSRLKGKPDGVSSLWVGIPHPDADKYAARNHMTINYTYPTFLSKNDKVFQKKLMGDLTPSWKQYNTHQELLDAANQSKESYLKKRIGAGGFSVIKLSSVTSEKIQKNLRNTNPDEWYIESAAQGDPWSVQCIKDTDGTITTFGLSQQRIVDDTIYTGAKILDISSIPNVIRDQVSLATERAQPILEDYVGFFGIDFMVRGETISVLEFNVRLTAASIPTLLRNNLGTKTTATYTEDKEQNEMSSYDIVLVADDLHHTSDIMSFNHLPEIAVGYSII